MAVPPQLIKLKRKRGDEPVDTLVIERDSKKQTRETLDSGFIFRLVQTPIEENDLSSSAVIVGSNGQTDSLKRSQAAENVTLRTKYSSLLLATSEPISSGQKRKEAPTASAIRPKRVFHLSKERSSSNLRRSPSNTSLNRIHKNRGSRHSGIAIISEQRKSTLQALVKRDSTSNLTKSISSLTAEDPSLAAAQPQTRKRPNASASERKWRDETWTKPSTARDSTEQQAIRKAAPIGIIPDSVDKNDDDDQYALTLAAELQKWSIEEAAAEKPSVPTTQTQDKKVVEDEKNDLLKRQTANSKPLKHRPKPQPPRAPTADFLPDTQEAPSQHPPPADPVDTVMDLDSDSDYVYDTYIREPDAGLFATKTTRSLPAVGMDGIETEAATEAEAENVGYLVIRPEDTEAWEEFMSDGEESGDDEHGWGSSDSNAEDYHGNDYPEDEDGEEWVSDDYGFGGGDKGDGSEYGSADAEWED